MIERCAMHVLMVSDVYFPRVNGVSTSIATFRTALAECGVRTTLVAPDYGGPGICAGDDARQDILRVPARPVPRDPEDRIMRWRALTGLAPLLARQDVDLVHIQTPFLAHYAGLRFARALALPAVASYHTLFEEYLHHYVPFVPGGWTRGMARRFSRTQCNALDAVVVPSSPMRERLAEYGVTAPMHVLPTGMPAAAFAQGDGAAFRTRHGIAPQRPVALFVGRVAHEKNIGFLLQALVRARRILPDMLLIVAGDGPARASLRDQAARLGLDGNVLFLGYLDRHSELPACYAAADLFAFASRTETQGLVLLEAMAAGTPVLALAQMGTRDILEPAPSAHIGHDDPPAFGAQMAALLADRAQLARRGAAAREDARQWSAQAMAARLADLYRALAEARGGAVTESSLSRHTAAAASRQAGRA